jgi:hypothetical protein
MSTRAYSADGVTAAWGIISLEEGFAAGTFLREIQAGPNFTHKDNGYGGTVTMFNGRRHGRLIVQMNRESAKYQQILTQANADYVVRALAPPLVVRETSTRTVTIYNGARPEGIPGLTLSTGPSIVAWTFIFTQAIRQSFGFNHNVVGA